MASKQLYQDILGAKVKGRKQFAVLIDPDKVGFEALERTVALAEEAQVDYLFVGGSLLVNDGLGSCLQRIRQRTDLPVILFPGSTFQLHDAADAILYLSLISGRNAELLIGQQVLAAPYLKASALEVISTGYVLIDGGVPTTVSYMSNTQPIPSDKVDIAVCTAMAGELLGLKMIYLDAGSGARTPVSTDMVEAVREAIDGPLIVGGGIRRPEDALARVAAGADIIVVGNAIEKDPALVIEMAAAIHTYEAGPDSGELKFEGQR
jgi:phosphoglycerol geranylgeranyltransferase